MIDLIDSIIDLLWRDAAPIGLHNLNNTGKISIPIPTGSPQYSYANTVSESFRGFTDNIPVKNYR